MTASTSTLVCMLYFHDHSLHPIIGRQMQLLKASGYRVVMIDRTDEGTTKVGRPDSSRPVRTARMSLFSRWLWWILKRILPPAGRLRYWKALSKAQAFATALRYLPAALRVEADLYHAHDLETLPAALIAGRLRSRPVIFDAHEMDSARGPLGLTGRDPIKRRLEHVMVPRVDALVVPNRSRAAVYAQELRPTRQPTVILNCPPLTQVERSDLLKDAADLPASARVVLYHGVLGPGRALDNLVRASAQFDEGTSLVLMGGRNPYHDEVLQPLCQNGPWKARVRFLPYVPHEQVMPYVAGADLGIVVYEPINLNNYLCAPTKLYEYVMAGVPILVANLPELTAFLDRYPVGVCTPCTSPEAIAATVNRFFRMGVAVRERMSAAFEEARTCHNWEKQGPILLSLYQDLLSRPAGSRG